MPPTQKQTVCPGCGQKFDQSKSHRCTPEARSAYQSQLLRDILSTLNTITLHLVEQAAAANKLDQIINAVSDLNKKADQIIMTEQEALAAIKAVDAKTTEIGTAVGAEGDTIQKVSDLLDQIIAGKVGTVSPEVAAALTGLATTTQAVADNLGTHETLLTAILAKGQPPVPPTPVPTPTPAPSV